MSQFEIRTADWVNFQRRLRPPSIGPAAAPRSHRPTGARCQQLKHARGLAADGPQGNEMLPSDISLADGGDVLQLALQRSPGIAGQVGLPQQGLRRLDLPLQLPAGDSPTSRRTTPGSSSGSRPGIDSSRQHTTIPIATVQSGRLVDLQQRDQLTPRQPHRRRAWAPNRTASFGFTIWPNGVTFDSVPLGAYGVTSPLASLAEEHQSGRTDRPRSSMGRCTACTTGQLGIASGRPLLIPSTLSGLSYQH